MRKIALTLAALVLASLPASGATRACSAGLVTAGVCRVSTNRLISYDLPAAAASELLDAIAAQHGCATITATTCSTTCTQQLANAGVCAVGEVGTTVTVTKAAFADATIRGLFLTYIRQLREEQAVAPARATARATPDADISN